MLENINEIGRYIKNASQDLSILDLMVNQIGEGGLEYILEIDVKEDGISKTLRDYDRNVVKDALFYQAGRGFLGGGLRLDFYKESKVKGACDFCEISDKYEPIKELIENHIAEENNSKGFAIIKINGKLPRELFTHKFLDKMYSTMYKKLKGKHRCQLCGSLGEGYNTAIYKFYTNDKEIYGNFTICEDCISNILIGRSYAEKNLNTYWIDSNVLFLPREFDSETARLYEAVQLNDKLEATKLLQRIRDTEIDVLDEVGQSKAITDIVFYEKEAEKTFYIYHQIQSVLPSRFSEISSRLKHYKLRLYTVLEYTAAVKISFDKAEPIRKEKIRMLEAMFKGKKIDRNLFFKRVLDVYKVHYKKDEHKKFYCMRTINRIYNFLCDCGCLEKGWNVMMNYKNYTELFEQNTKYFDSAEKKAWFILGKCYDYMIYKIKDKMESKSEGDEGRKTSLEKNFFFARKFNFEDFIYFCNLLEEKAIKHGKSNTTYKKMICEAKELMSRRENKLSLDEAKYLFFWGMDSYFRAEQNEADGGEING